MENIKFSIIIPAYNAENFIDKCLGSILSQNYKNYEIIVVDDCSKDSTLKVLKKYKNVRIFSTKTNSRQGAARNIGIKNATGDYILFIDADDSILEISAFEKIANKLNNDMFPDILYLGMEISGINNLELHPNEENVKKDYRLGKTPYINSVSICLKREFILENNIFFPEKIRYEDVYFNFLAIEKSKTYSYLDILYYKYNNHNSSTTTTPSFMQPIDTIILIENMFNLFDIIDKENYKYLEERILQQASRVSVRLQRIIDYKKSKNKESNF